MAWVTIEGVNGVGKTYVASAAARQLGTGCRLIAELTDLDISELPGQVVAALAAGDGTFLRGGYPSAETLALLALKVRAYETARADGRAEAIVLEDRGVDTVAVYQAAIMTGADAPLAEALAVADQVYDTARRWRPAPDRTVLLVDDLPACVTRLEQRTGAGLRPEDRGLLSRVARLYLAHAAREPDRFILIDRRRHDAATVARLISRICQQAAKDLPCPA